MSYLDSDEWRSWGYWVNRDLEGNKDRIWIKLLSLLDIARHVGMSGYDWKMLRSLLFVPFSAQWNRKVNLIVDEIELAQERIRGKDVDEQERLLDRQWTLSGISRP